MKEEQPQQRLKGQQDYPAPELEECLLRSGDREIVDLELERMRAELARTHEFDDGDEEPEAGPPTAIN